MYSILLVEDEKMELDTLKNYVNWQACGIDRVYTARGARSALECINSVEPDIMITDIQMPGMSGIDLAKLVREEGHPCKIVFLTGYDRFDYAKEAVSLHAEDFLLKPFQVEEVEELTTKLVGKIEEERNKQNLNHIAEERILDQACRGILQDPQNISEIYFHKKEDQVLFRILGVVGLEEDQKIQIRAWKENSHTLWMDPFFIIVYPVYLSAENLTERIRKTFAETELRVVFYEDTASLSHLHEAVKSILFCSEDLYFDDEKQVMNAAEHRVRGNQILSAVPADTRDLLLEAILLGKTEKAIEKLDLYMNAYRQVTREKCARETFSLFVFIHNVMEQRGEMDDSAEVPVLLQAESFHQLRENMISYVGKCSQVCRKIREARTSYFVKKYIGMNYGGPCTVEEMAEELHISPNYLRKKFKEETGLTVLEYLTEERLRVACTMLQDPSRKVKDIAIAVGYENISYFTQLFARKYGVTPNEYRKYHP